MGVKARQAAMKAKLQRSVIFQSEGEASSGSNSGGNSNTVLRSPKGKPFGVVDGNSEEDERRPSPTKHRAHSERAPPSTTAAAKKGEAERVAKMNNKKEGSYSSTAGGASVQSASEVPSRP